MAVQSRRCEPDRFAKLRRLKRGAPEPNHRVRARRAGFMDPKLENQTAWHGDAVPC
jgi:hypothetical protein